MVKCSGERCSKRVLIKTQREEELIPKWQCYKRD